MSALLGWFGQCFNALPSWIDSVGSSIGVAGFFGVLVALTGLSIGVAYLVVGLTGGHGRSDKANSRKNKED